MNILKGARIDPTGTYRYLLWRIWDTNKPRVLFVMLNPSTADAETDDPTIRRCIGFAKSWGYGSLQVVNLFAYRATNPEELRKCADPIGPRNDDYIEEGLESANRVIMAWGTKGTLLGRDRIVKEILKPFRPHCLQLSKDGHPKHPLYIAAKCEPILFEGGLVHG